MIVDKMTDLIGGTPLIRLDSAVTGLKNIDLYGKLEMMNPFGSVKDRTAWGMIRGDLQAIKARGMVIYENSSGNTAKSLQAIAAIHGIEFRLVSALAKVEEQKDVLQVMGAGIMEVAGASDCFDPADPNDPQYLIERMVHQAPGEIYAPSQFTNEKNPAFHEETTAAEIIADLGQVDYFFGGLGTAGSNMGITRRLRAANPHLVSVGLIARANQFIPGIRNREQIMQSGIFNPDHCEALEEVSEQDAIDGMLSLCRQSAILGGISAGGNYYGAIRYLRAIDETLSTRKSAVFIVCDRMEWYLSYLKERRPALFGEAAKENALSLYEEQPLAAVAEIGADALDDFCREGPVMMVDMRAAPSFALIHIPGSINMPLELFRKWIDGQNPFAPGTKVMLICAVGEKSRYYAGYLRTLGCEAYNLDGGIMAWRDAQAAPQARAA